MRHFRIDYQEVVNRLIGNITPIGKAEVDEIRFDNLEAMCKLVNSLVQEIDRVHYDNKDSHEHSIKKASDYARNFIDNTLGIK